MLKTIGREFEKNRYFYILLFVNLFLNIIFGVRIDKIFDEKMDFSIFNILVNNLMIMLCRYSELNRKRTIGISIFMIGVDIIANLISVDLDKFSLIDSYMLIYSILWLGIIVYCSKNLKEIFSIGKIFSIQNIEVKSYYLILLSLFMGLLIVFPLRINIIELFVIFLLPVYESVEKERDFRDIVISYTSSIWLYTILILVMWIIIFILLLIIGLLGVFFYEFIVSEIDFSISSLLDYNLLLIKGIYPVLMIITTITYIIFLWIKELDGNTINLIRDKVVKISGIIFKYIFYVLKYGLNIMMIYCLIKYLIKWELPNNFFGNWLYLYFTISVLEKIFGLLENMNIYVKRYLIGTDICLYILVVISMGVRIYNYGMSNMRTTWIIILSILGMLNILKYTKYNKYTIISWISLFVSLMIIYLSTVMSDIF